MSKECEIYMKQIIDLTEKERDHIIISASTIFEIKDDSQLGKLIRESMKNKIKNCDKTIKEYKLSKCLEIGFAFGISAMYILSNENTTLTSIDPFQTTQWKSYGLKLIKKLEFNNRHKLDVTEIKLCSVIISYFLTDIFIKSSGQNKGKQSI